MDILITLIAIVLIWNLIPNILILFVNIPWKDKIAAIKCFVFNAFPKNLLVLIPDLLAPIVVPIALLFTKWEDDKLPSIFTWWDNDVGINGDRFYWVLDPNTGKGVPLPIPVEDTPEARALCYWAEGHHPRSFWARFVWLGLRNRASKLAEMLGYRYSDDEMLQTHTIWGDPEVGRSKEGWVVFNFKDNYQLYMVKKLGPVCIRINYGFKLWSSPPADRYSMVVGISFSLISWKGDN